jgi:Flp pilus assembly protein TadB
MDKMIKNLITIMVFLLITVTLYQLFEDDKKNEKPKPQIKKEETKEKIIQKDNDENDNIKKIEEKLKKLQQKEKSHTVEKETIIINEKKEKTMQKPQQVQPIPKMQEMKIDPITFPKFEPMKWEN